MNYPCSISVCIDETLLLKLRCLSLREVRTVSGLTRHLLREYVRKYEATNGPIETKQALTLR